MTDYLLKFDGYKLSLIGDGAVVKSWDAISGNPGSQSPGLQGIAFRGPLPEGRWSFNTTAIQTITVADDVFGTVAALAYKATGGEIFHKGTWYGGTKSFGLERVELAPIDGTDNLKRDGLFIHGGDQYGSAGCIDLGHNEVDFFRTLTQNGIGRISLNVQYDPSLYTDPHPLAGITLDSGPLSRGLFPTDHLGNPIQLYNNPTSFLFPAAFAASASEFNNVVGHAFDGASPQDLALLINAVSDGRIQAGAAFVDPTSNDRFTGPFYTTAGDKIVVSSDSTTWFAAMVRNGEIGRIVQNNGDGSGKDSTFNNSNNRIWDDREIATDPTEKVTDVKLKLNGETTMRSATNPVDYSAIGQIFGSAIGRAIVGKDGNPFVSLTAGTVAGFVGQKFVQALINGPGAIDLAQLDLAAFFNGKDVSLAGAGLGAASSFLAAELATSIGLEGVGAQMFASAAGGYLGSVLNQVRQQGFAVLTTGIDWNVALHASEVNIATTIGSLLAHEFVHPETQFGAVGGQLAGAVGSALAYSFSLALGPILNVFLPGVGAFFGTIIGTMLGDAIAGDPASPKAFHDIEIIGSDPTHFQNRLVGTDDHGNADISEAMGDQVARIANSYLDAVHGAAIYYSGKVMIGYNAGAAPYQYITGWFPDGINGPAAHFASATDAIQQGVRELLMNTEVIGGDLLIKRAHQAFMNGPHAAPTEIAPDFTDLATLGGDLRTAQDYEQYLNDRETINALIELYPESAFTAGWAATFARVHELGLDQARGSDFIGGLVGYLDSVNKAGLGAEAANATVSRGIGNTVVVEIKIPNGAEVPGSLSVFADQLKITSDASGQTLQFTVDSGIVASGEHFLGAGASAGDGANDLWIGAAGAENTFTGTGGHDILVGGTMNDVIYGGGGWDFIDGGYGNDYLFGQDGSDILRGGVNTDFLFGGLGNDSYVFNRGDGADTVFDEYNVTADTSHWKDEWRDDDGDGANEFHHDWIVETTTSHPDAGTDTLLFGPGISVLDVVVRAASNGHDLIVGVKDPAHPGVAFEQLSDSITLTNWLDPKDRIEFLRFADGTSLNIGAAIGSFLVPFGETLSRNSVPENSAIGTVVGTVSTYDLEASASLSYSLVDDVTGGRFAINASTGAISVAGPLNFEGTPAWPIMVRVADQNGNGFNKPFVINVTNVNEAPADITLAGGSVPENSLGGTIVGTAHGIDPDAGTVFHYSLLDDAGGRFFIYPTTGIIVNYSSQTIDYETASSYHVTVRAGDRSGLYVDRTVILQITDVNDNGMVSDFDGNRHDDILWRRDDGTMSVWDNGQISLAHVIAGPGTVTGDWTIAGKGDFDGNGRDDILGVRNDGTVTVWDNGQLAGAHWIAGPGTVSNGWHVAGVGDFDGNGRDDILGVRDDGTVTVWDNGQLAAAHWIADPGTVSSGWHFSGTGDFDGNGHDDILWVRDDGTASVWDNGQLAGAHWIADPGTITNGWHVAGVGDFDGNGRDDILGVRDNGTVAVWDNGQLAGAHWIAGPGTVTGDWHVAGVGDFDGNGHDDILWRPDNGTVSVWDNGALAAAHWLADPSQVASGWHIV